jgi:hypothetical protein
VPLEVFDASEARAAALEEQAEGLEAERDALQDKVWASGAGPGERRARACGRPGVAVVAP